MDKLNEAFTNLEISEAFGLAIKVEEDGYTLYQKTIEMTDNPRAKEDLEFLRDQEKGHKVFFEKLLKDTGKEYKADSESALYVWVKENLMAPIQKAIENNTLQSFHAVLSIGMELEKKSIQFYKQLKNAADSKENKKAINKIIKEEKRHQKFLKFIIKYSNLGDGSSALWND
mgnify:CR=1 FL=1|jgi:rubrerythrin